MKGIKMAKQAAGESAPESAAESSPYINEDQSARASRFAWAKTKAAKVTAIAVGGTLALGAAFAGGAVAGQLASHNGGPAIGAPHFEDRDSDGPKGFGHDKRGGFDRDGDHEFQGGPGGKPGDRPAPPMGEGGMPVAPGDAPAPAPLTTP